MLLCCIGNVAKKQRLRQSQAYEQFGWCDESSKVVRYKYYLMQCKCNLVHCTNQLVWWKLVIFVFRVDTWVLIDLDGKNGLKLASIRPLAQMMFVTHGTRAESSIPAVTRKKSDGLRGHMLATAQKMAECERIDGAKFSKECMSLLGYHKRCIWHHHKCPVLRQKIKTESFVWARCLTDGFVRRWLYK